MILDTTIDNLINCKTYHQRFSEFGERAWIAKGKTLEIIYWDVGNGWCLITQILPRNKIINNGFRQCTRRFFQALRKIKDQ